MISDSVQALLIFRNALLMNVIHWISSWEDSFDTFDQLFDCGAASEFKRDDTNPRGQQPLRQAGESQKGVDKKCNFPPSISKPAESTPSNSNKSNNLGN
jgi:hypothetical protein